MSEKYPQRICKDCAIQHGGRSPSMACFYMGICDACSTWKAVTQPRDFGYPKVVYSEDKAKVIRELESVKSDFIRNGNIFAADEVESMIEKYRIKTALH